jgi:uncharacterized protein
MQFIKPWLDWQRQFEDWHLENQVFDDASHDIHHFRRVAKWAYKIVQNEGEDLDFLVILAACYFHDVINLAKNHPKRTSASTLAAKLTLQILEQINFPKEKISKVCHAVEAHSYSAQIKPGLIEAKVLRDADRLDAIGSIGVLRTLYISGSMKRPLYHKSDPLAKNRALNGGKYSLDHFNIKSIDYPRTLSTSSALNFAKPLLKASDRFVQQMQKDIKNGQRGAALDLCNHYVRHANPFKTLFHPTDLKAKSREKDLDKYIFDSIVEHKELSWFHKELQEEIASLLD